MKTLSQVIKEQPIASRRRIAKRVSELANEEMTMRELRKARKITQEELAKRLGVKQEQISRYEKRTDMHLSTLRRSVEALGGTLELTVSLPKTARVRLTGFCEQDTSAKAL